MYVEQLYTNCLAEAAYYIESNGEAAIIDPLRETEPYLKLAEERGAKIKYIFETHFHADFVSGHIDLAKQTGAKIVFGPTAKADYDVLVAEDEEVFILGNAMVKVLHTPGHTMESSCFLLIDEEGREHSVFTGDTLFIGDVGRPDLAVKHDLSREDLARYLYQSIHNKLLPLADETILYPGHGAGSQCGKALSKSTVSTIGAQKADNYALQVKDENEFVSKVIEGLTPPPQYFPKVAAINHHGYESIEKVMERANTPLSAIEFEEAIINHHALIIDTRPASQFCSNHIAQSLNIGLDGAFAVWVGSVVEDLNTPILLVTEIGTEAEAALRLARVGYDNVVGYLNGGYETWTNAGKEGVGLQTMCPVTFRTSHFDKHILDVRTVDEYLEGHVARAENIPLNELIQSWGHLDMHNTYYVYCKGGYRSMIAASLMQREGYHVVNVKKGYEGIVNPKKTCCCVRTNSM